jgi:acyl carrier protein
VVPINLITLDHTTQSAKAIAVRVLSIATGLDIDEWRDASLSELGIDSIGVMACLGLLEVELGGRISDAAGLMAVQTVHEFIVAVGGIWVAESASIQQRL